MVVAVGAHELLDGGRADERGGRVFFTRGKGVWSAARTRGARRRSGRQQVNNTRVAGTRITTAVAYAIRIV